MKAAFESRRRLYSLIFSPSLCSNAFTYHFTHYFSQSFRPFAFTQDGRGFDPSAKGKFSLRLKKAGFESWWRPCSLNIILFIISLNTLANLSPSSNLSLTFPIIQSFTQPTTKKFTTLPSRTHLTILDALCYLDLDPTWPYFNPTWAYLGLPNPTWSNFYVLTTCRPYVRTSITRGRTDSRTGGRTDAVLSDW